MRITKRQLRRIIKEERSRLLNEASLQRSKAQVENALSGLLVAYMEEHLDMSGSNRSDALDRAKEDLKSYVRGAIANAVDFERDPQSYT
jgi:hypothetical protein